MTETQTASFGAPHAALVYAPADTEMALALWRALRGRGLSVGLNDDTPGRAEATHLIVLCSQAAADDISVTTQVRAFESLHARAAMMAVMVEDVLPPVLQTHRGEDGFLKPVPTPRQIRATTGGRASIRAAAGEIERFMLSGGDAVARGRRRPLRRYAGPIAAGFAIAGGALGLLAWSLHVDLSNARLQVSEARLEIAQAQNEAADAHVFARSLISELTQDLPLQARRDVLVQIGDDVLRSAFGDDPTVLNDDELARYAQVLHFLGEARDSFGDPSGATAAFEHAHAMTGQLLARAPEDADRRFEHAQSSFWLANSQYRRGDLRAAEAPYQSYYELMAALREDYPDNMLYRAEYAHATVNMGIVALGSDQPQLAAERFNLAIGQFESGPLQAQTAAMTDIANARGWQAQALERVGDPHRALAERAAQAAIYANALETRPSKTSSALGFAFARQQHARLLAEIGSTSEAAAVLDEAIAIVAPLWEDRRDLTQLRRRYAELLRQRAQFALWSGRTNAAQLLVGEARRITVNWDENGADDERHGDRAAIHYLLAQIALQQSDPDAASIEATRAILAAEQAIAAGFEGFYRLAAAASFVNGEAMLESSQPAEADRAYRRALAHLPNDSAHRSSSEADLLARLQFRLGQGDAAAADVQTLIEQGYQRPDFVEFWRQPEAMMTAQASSTQQTEAPNDG